MSFGQAFLLFHYFFIMNFWPNISENSEIIPCAIYLKINIPFNKLNSGEKSQARKFACGGNETNVLNERLRKNLTF